MAMQKFIQGGKGFVGIHSASDTEYEMGVVYQIGRTHVYVHPSYSNGSYLHPLNRRFIGTFFQSPIGFRDEWYVLGPENSRDSITCLKFDEGSYFAGKPTADYPNGGMNGKHPISWYHEYDGGRSFYTAIGHLPGVYSDAVFLEHLFEWVYWAATGKGYNQE